MPRGKSSASKRLVRYDGNALDALRAHHVCDSFDGHGAVDRLPAGHRDGIVEKDLERDIGFRGNGLAYRQRTRVIEGAVAQILKRMAAAVEHRARNPVHAFAAHLDQAVGVALHPVGHEMTADAGQCLRAFGHFRRRVVRAAGAEVGDARSAADVDYLGLLVQQFVCPCRQVQARHDRIETPGDDAGQLQR